MLRARAVLGRPFDVLDEIARAAHLRSDHRQHFLGVLLQLVFHVQGRGGDERVDAPAPGVFHRLRAAVDVLEGGAGEPGDRGVLHALGDCGHRLEIAFRGDGEAGLDDVDAHRVEHVGDFELFLQGHRRAGRLLAVAQRGVEDEDPVLVGGGRGGMRAGVLVLGHCSVLLGGGGPAGHTPQKGALKSTPERQGETPGRRSGASKKQTGNWASDRGPRGARRVGFETGDVCAHESPRSGRRRSMSRPARK